LSLTHSPGSVSAVKQTQSTDRS